jgi:hypothetical protein
MGTNRSDDVPREDFRLTLARKALTASKAAAEDFTDHQAARHWGRLEVVVEQLLQFVDEQANR